MGLRLAAAALALAVLTLSGPEGGVAQPAPADRPILPLTVTALNKRIYLARGPSTSNNSNNGFIVGDHGVILFDTKNTQDDERALLAEIARVTDKPITHVLLSHSDGDHVNGLPVLAKGVIVFAHSYARNTMDALAAAGGPRAPDPAYLPKRTFDARDRLTIDGVRMELRHYAPAHTGGDLILYLPEDRIVFMGDIVISEIPEPFMHMENSGSPQGVIASIKGMIALDADTYVSGHGLPIDKAELKRRLALYQAKLARIRPLVAKGRTNDEIKAVLGEPPAAPAAGGRPARASFTDNIIAELKR